MAAKNCLSRPAVDCKSYVDAHCIVWSGASLLCIGAVTNERLDSILTKIDTKLCTLEKSSGRIYNETPTGVLNAINKIFTTNVPFTATSTAVFLNGVRQKLGASYDYAETGDNQIFFISAPYSTDNIIIDYNPA